MLSNREKIQLANNKVKKAEAIRDAEVKKIKDKDKDNLMKTLDKLNFLDFDFSKKELLNGLSHLIFLKKTKSPILTSDHERENNKVIFPKS